jgi:putative transposase
MARLKRLFYPHHPQHILQSSNNGIPCFREHEDFVFYLDKLRLCSENNNVAVHAYVLMENHVHLLVTPDNYQAISRMMQTLGVYYARYFNRKYCRTGTMWEGRYRSTLVENKKYPLLLMWFIETNPVRAGYVHHPFEYKYSSYQHHANGVFCSLIKPLKNYLDLANDSEMRLKRYQHLLNQDLGQETIKLLQEATSKGWVLGSRQFKHKLSKEFGCKVEPEQRGGDRKSLWYRQSKTGCLE